MFWLGVLEAVVMDYSVAAGVDMDMDSQDSAVVDGDGADSVILSVAGVMEG